LGSSADRVKEHYTDTWQHIPTSMKLAIKTEWDPRERGLHTESASPIAAGRTERAHPSHIRTPFRLPRDAVQEIAVGESSKTMRELV
jgi:hypothetical protein